MKKGAGRKGRIWSKGVVKIRGISYSSFTTRESKGRIGNEIADGRGEGNCTRTAR